MSNFTGKYGLLITLIALQVTGFLYGASISPPVKLQFEQLTSIQGLSNNTVLDITQDGEGFIWIATREGLNKYDGHRVTTFYANDTSGIPGNFVEKLLFTRNQQLLVGTQKGICTYQKETGAFKTILHKGRSLGDITQFRELQNGSILISASEGLFVMDQSLAPTRVYGQMLRDFIEYRKGIIWGLLDDEILIMNLEGDIIRRYSNNDASLIHFDLSSENTECLFKDAEDNIWLGTKRDGIGFYDQELDMFFNLQLEQGVNPIEDNFVRVINQDKIGRLWIGTESGLYIYNTGNKEFTFYGQCFDETEKGLNDKAIYSIFRSRDGIMWIGTYFGGVNYTSLEQGAFNRIYADGGVTRLGGNAVSEMLEAADGRIWLGTEDGGISILDPQELHFSYLKHRPGSTGSLSSNNVHALEEDKHGNIWIGTFLGGLNKYDPHTGKIEIVDMVPPGDERQTDVYNKSIFSIFIDSKERLWVGSIGGLYMKEQEGDELKLWQPLHFLNNFIYHIEEDNHGTMWVATYEEGLYRIDADLSIRNYRTDNNHNIKSNRIVFIQPGKDEFIWFGTVEGGFLKYSREHDLFTSYTTEDGLPNNTVYACLEDDKGNLWLSTNKGISKFNISTEEFENYTENDGLIGNQFNFKSGLRTSSGTIYFGAVNGLTFFDPGNLRKNEKPPEVHFTDFRISNNSVPVNDNSILTRHINYQEEIELEHNQKVFSIEYVALNYLAPKNIRYAYYLEGLEYDWNYVGNKMSATYTNLSPGKYIFHLKASSNEQNWGTQEKQLYIHIHPPFWTSVWGFILYGAILIVSTLLIIRFYSIRQKEKMNIRIARLEKEKNEEISKHRLNFFTYISHEFKTPLTLIIATLEHIMNYDNVLPRFKDYSLLMRKNAMRLLFLINQLMDFRKIETDHASLRFNKGEIIGFIRSTFMTFKPLLKKLNIKPDFSSNVESYIVYFDADKLEKILTNLISNSCKSFKKSGNISMNVHISERKNLASPSLTNEMSGDLIITIKDDGPGIPPEKLEYIHQPFVSADPSDFYSSGIGLSLVYSLVKYLNGQIRFNSEKEKGTTVTIQLPLIHNPEPELIRNDTFIENNTSFDPENTSLFLDSNEESDIVLDFQNNGAAKEFEILIVEDNNELASFLYHHFASVFKVSKAQDGKEALERISHGHPDLIISDIMMPRMDGYTLCKAVKENIETSHIPVILLTSKTKDEARIEGLYRGADAYVGKPFNLKELDLQIRNILRFRESLRKHFASFGALNESVTSLGNKDQALIKLLTDTVHKHLDNGSLDVDLFCKEVNLSRTLLHMKIKKITGQSTTGFIKNIRMNEARKMLKENNLTIAEIAYRVGYNDPAYFSKAFKQFFGTSPSKVEEYSN